MCRAWGLVLRCPGSDMADRSLLVILLVHLRLGKARPGVNPAYDFTLEELGYDLGAALMRSGPAMSQLYVNTS